MTDVRWDLLAIGNALVDLVADVADAFLEFHGIVRGQMSLIDRDRALMLTEAMGEGRLVAGGSAANTAVGVAALGGRAAFIGKCADDRMGRMCTRSLVDAGVDHVSDPGPAEPPTGRSMIVVTPDHERSMSTFLGASTTLSARDVDPEMISAARITFLEGYLFHVPGTAEALRVAAAEARRAGRKIALSLSDPHCAETNRDAMQAVLGEGTDFLFANEEEVKALYETPDFGTAMERARNDVPVAVLTRGAAGAVVAEGETTIEVPAVPADVVDLTGAGDLFAAGYLCATSRSLPPLVAARLGALCASTVISGYGARPRQNLARQAREAGLI